MSALAELQRGFAGAVRGLPDAGGDLDVVEAGLAAARRLAIYRNHHRISLAAALAANFPTVAALLGPAFEGAAMDFVAAAPPAEPCVSAYGDGLAAFLEAEPRLAALPYIGDVARLDRACNKAERADDIPVFGPADLERASARGLADLRLAGHPSLSLLRSRYPLLGIRGLARGQGANVSLDEGGVLLMVWRNGGTVDCAELDAAAYRFVTAMSVGEPLAVAAGDLPPERLASILARYVLTGAFAALGL
ncbi:MAG TPA: DNA-binding domain-containing protein [Dongiaceae bacterium]|nr:DNA-binding domain-containing protein [Dongiaceae bacterium]